MGINGIFDAALRIAGVLIGLAASTAAGRAEEMSFVLRNGHPNAVEVELYSDARSHVWPGDGQVYLLDDGESKNIDLSCQSGEHICYGAWTSGDQETYWGVGPGNKERCDDCCYTCNGGETETIDLVP